MDHMMAGIEDIVGKTGNYNIRDKFKRFDNRFIRPYLIKNLQVAYRRARTAVLNWSVFLSRKVCVFF